ncbi:unnamed protein product, partial [Amoebophrya sp. A25]|eukprot:GSA25T00011889001.1
MRELSFAASATTAAPASSSTPSTSSVVKVNTKDVQLPFLPPPPQHHWYRRPYEDTFNA